MYGRKRAAHALDNFQRVRCGQDPDSHEGGGFAVEANVGVVVLGAQHHVGNFAQTNDDAALLLYNQLLELLGRPQVGVRNQIHGNHRALGATERRQVVVLGQCIAHIRG